MSDDDRGGHRFDASAVPPAAHPLDNAVWHALNGPLARFRAPDARAGFVRFDPEVNVFGAVDRFGDSTWPMIAEAVGLEGFCALFRDAVVPPPPGWEMHFQARVLQMVAEELAEPRGLEVRRLGSADAEEMLALAQLTEPGPFFARTHELGRFIGVHRDGRLVAMAGERMRIPGWVEVSAVCTHPDTRGEGLAGELTLQVAQAIRQGGDEAFLHVLVDNENAIRLYRKLGFVTRREVEVHFVQWHGPDWSPRPSADTS
jgi:ribosomal protein S18 acetylase RimI-like enzyme